ncbi:MAG: tRNA 2-thiocytidine biosynthesis TtcA family protein [Thermovirgaceae bacterium]|nr:tRNA 2-thiocytidine biosynthesis TtcA family protein [Thermovirgaceae bacterium]
MIGPGDRITVGLSGGKDSTLLLAALARLKEKGPVDFHLDTCLVDITGGRTDTRPMKDLCEGLGVEFDIVSYPVLEILRARNERSPCSFCANMRGGILFDRAKKKGSTAVAMGHNLDDAVETVLLNLFYAGSFRCFAPRSWRSRTDLWLLRPLVYLPERSIAEEISRMGVKTISPMCTFSRESKRARIKNLVEVLEKEIPDIRSQVLHALREARIEDTWNTGALPLQEL